MTPANEPGLPLPEEPEPLQDEPGTPALDPTADAERPDHTADPESAGEAAAPTAPRTTSAAEAEAEAEAARERAVFDELVASFHTETAPDPIPRKIIRHPVLNTEPAWEQPILEPTDEMTVDKYFPSEHFEPPDPPPLPDASGATKAAWTLLVGGVLFLVLRTLFHWQTESWTFWLAVSGVFGGIVSLVVRMQPDRDDYDDPENGAVV